MCLPIPLAFILILNLKDIMLNHLHIATEIFWLTGKDAFCKIRGTILHPFSKFMI